MKTIIKIRNQLLTWLGWSIFWGAVIFAIWCFCKSQMAYALPQVTPAPIKGVPVRSPLISLPTTKTITFAWDASAGAAYYNFYLVGPSTLTLLGTTTNTTISAANVNLTMTNVFGVTAVDVFTNESPLSATIAVSLPSAPLNLHPTQFTP